MDVRDVPTGREFTVRARATVNAAGAHAGVIMQSLGARREYPLVKVMSVLTSKPASDIALAAPASEGRMLTLVPWRGVALVGTRQSSTFAQPGDTGVSGEEVDALIKDANTAFPALRITRDDVRLVHRGLVPAVKNRQGVPDLRMIADVCDHTSDGADGAFTVLSAKYSSARGIAERVTSLVARKLGKRVRPSRTAITVLPGAGIADHEALAIEKGRELDLDLPIATIRHLIARYAERTPVLIELMHARPELREPLTPAEPTVGAEVVYVVQHEMALTLSDIVLRRTPLGSAGHPGAEALRASARIAAEELDWDHERIELEIANVEKTYVIS
jgi:glycerol-3-phosphate dehydrogenase